MKILIDIWGRGIYYQIMEAVPKTKKGAIYMKKFFSTILIFLVCSLSFAQGTQEEPKAKAVELEFYCQKNEVVEVMTELIDKFEAENPGITVTLTSTPDPKTVLMTRLAAHDVPDIINTYPAEVFYRNLFDEGILEDLTGEPVLNNIQPDTIKMAKYEGKDIAVPMTLSIFGLYVRTDILAQYNLPIPTTYDELISDAKVLKSNGIIPIAFSDKATWTIGQILERSMGIINNDIDGEFRQIASGQLNVKDSKALRAYSEMMIELHEYSYEDSLSVEYETSLSDVATGKAAMVIMGSWALATMETANPDLSDNIVMVPIPNPIGETKVPINIDTSYSIASSTKNKAEAIKFLEFLTRTENAQIYCDVDKTPNMVKGVEYHVEPFAKMFKTLQDGDIFLTAVNFWPSGLRDQLVIPAQRLFLDSNIDSFLSSCDSIIKDYYNK